MKAIKILGIIWIIQVSVFYFLKKILGFPPEALFLFLGIAGAVMALVYDGDNLPGKRIGRNYSEAEEKERAEKIKNEMKESDPVFWIISGTTITFILIPILSTWII